MIINPNILIVDDKPHNIILLSSMLKQAGYNVRSTTSGMDALQEVKNDPPDLILLDINMPEMDGYEVCQKLKSDEKSKEIPVLFLSAMTGTDDKVKAFANGGVDYITKPFYFEEVEARVKVHLNLKYAREELQSLLSNTLTGSIEVLTEILSWVDPVVFHQALRMKRYVSKISRCLNLTDPWRFEVAALLSHVGCVAISADVVDKIYSGKIVNNEDCIEFEKHPALGANFLSRIPRMEIICQMIKRQMEPLGGDKPQGAPRDWDAVMIGRQMLKITTDYDILVMSGKQPEEALLEMKVLENIYSDLLIETMSEIIDKEREIEVKSVSFDELQAGMVLMSDIVTLEGAKLLRKKCELTANTLNLLSLYSKKIKEPIDVMVPPTKI